MYMYLYFVHDFRSLNEGSLSLNEQDIKQRAQPITDTDLQDKQMGNYRFFTTCTTSLL